MSQSQAVGARGLVVVAALRYRNYRLYWIGSLISIIGWQVQYVALAWLVYRLTDSPVYLGLVGLATSVPTIALTLFDGILADRMDRLRLLKITQVAEALQVFTLAVLTATGVINVWLILSLAAVASTIWAFDTPTRQALVPHLIEMKELINAIALASTVWQASRIIGPALGGVLIASLGDFRYKGWLLLIGPGAFGALFILFALVVASSQARIRQL